MKRMFAALFSSALLIGAPMVASPQTSNVRTAAGWALTNNVDKMTDAQSFTILRRSNEGTASLGIHCAEKSYVAFIVVPKALDADSVTLAQVRFDKREPTGFTLQRFDQALLVTAFGGSKTEANYVFMTDDVQKAMAGGFSADETARMGMAVVKAVRSSAQMVYRLSLATSGNGTEATFNLSGFSQAAAPMLKTCPIQ